MLVQPQSFRVIAKSQEIQILVNAPSEKRKFRREKISETNKRTNTFILYSKVHSVIQVT